MKNRSFWLKLVFGLAGGIALMGGRCDVDIDNDDDDFDDIFDKPIVQAAPASGEALSASPFEA